MRTLIGATIGATLIALGACTPTQVERWNTATGHGVGAEQAHQAVCMHAPAVLAWATEQGIDLDLVVGGEAIPPCPAAELPAVLLRIRWCESRDQYDAVSPSGAYRGAYQFARTTWNATAERAGRPDLIGVDPATAAPADQDAMAVELLGWQGTSPWPRCGR